MGSTQLETLSQDRSSVLYACSFHTVWCGAEGQQKCCTAIKSLQLRLDKAGKPILLLHLLACLYVRPALISLDQAAAASG